MNVGCTILANLVLFLIVGALFGAPGVGLLAALALFGVFIKVESHER